LVDVVVSVSGSTSIYGYTYIAEDPTLTSITPNKGSMWGENLVAITGTQFVTYLDSIEQNGNPVSPTQGTRLAAWTVNGATAFGTINLTTGELTPVNGGQIIGYIGGQPVTVPPTLVQFDQTYATGVTVTSATTMTVIAPAHDPATVNVSVVIGGTKTTMTDAYTFLVEGTLVITKQAVVCEPGRPEINATYCSPVTAGQYVEAGTEVTWQYMVKHVVIGINGQPLLEPLIGMTNVIVVDDQLEEDVCVIDSLQINVGTQCFAWDILGVPKP